MLSDNESYNGNDIIYNHIVDDVKYNYNHFDGGPGSHGDAGFEYYPQLCQHNDEQANNCSTHETSYVSQS